MDILRSFAALLRTLLSFLPTSPVQPFLDDMADLSYMGYVNWFIPFGFMTKVMEVWVGCNVSFLVYKQVKRISDKLL